MIDGVVVTPLRQIPDERGKIMHMLRNDEPTFSQFGEIYFSEVFPQVVKAWHLHKKMVLNYAAVRGMIKLVLWDGRQQSPTQGRVAEIFMGESQYLRVTIPPGIWNGFKGVGTVPALVANCASIPHDPEEIVRLDPFSADIPYTWDIRHG